MLLGEVAKQGWPQIIQDLPPELKPFWTFCEMITIADGLLLKGDRIIVPGRQEQKSFNFNKMMKKMGIHHITTRPHHHQSNGLAEGYIRIIKSLLQKAKETGDNPHAVTLIYHSTPLSDTLPSPFEMLHGQKPITDLPQIQYNSTITPDTLHSKDKHQEKTDGNILPIETKVMYITLPGKIWHQATVEKYLGYHSFKLKADNSATYASSSYDATSINQSKKGTHMYRLVNKSE